MKNAIVMWVGLSAKKDIGVEKSEPLNENTNSGKLVAEIEACFRFAYFYRTNLVKFPPLDSIGKLRYPTIKECALCFSELLAEIQEINPRVILLLGNKTAVFVFRQFGLRVPKLSYKYQFFKYEKRWYVPIHHPSYIAAYKRREKEKYIQAVKVVIDKCFSKEEKKE